MAFGSDSPMNRLATVELMGEPMAVQWTCFITVTLKEGVGIFQVEIQQCGDALYRQRGPAV